VNHARYPNSKSLDDLEPAFQIRTKAFIATLKQAGATVKVSATRRDRTRAWLMHFCCLIAESAAAAKPSPRTPIVTSSGIARMTRRPVRERWK
jgi:hypothetical protein